VWSCDAKEGALRIMFVVVLGARAACLITLVFVFVRMLLTVTQGGRRVRRLSGDRL
jgi:hypothetical protein